MSALVRGSLRVGAWWLLTLMLGWLCLASLFDRLAGQGVLGAAPSALAFGGNMARARAELAWRAGDLTLAGRRSREAVTRRPIDATTLRIAGSIALARGDASGGDALMRLAGAAGWRDRETQIYWAQAALDQGAYDVAAERLEAVARLGFVIDTRVVFRRMEATPAGRAALLRRWNGAGAWLPLALVDWTDLDAPAIAHRLVTVAAARAHLSRDELNAIVEPAIAAGRIDEAFALLRPDERTLAFPRDVAGPLDWQLSAAAGIDVTVDGGRDVLRVQATGPALLPFAERIVRLPPGHVRLTLRVDGARTDLPIMTVVECLSGQAAAVEAGPSSRGSFTVDLVIPPGCRAQRLGLAVTGEEARRGADLTLHPPTVGPAAAVP